MTSDAPLPSAQTSRILPCAGRSLLPEGQYSRWVTKRGSSNPAKVVEYVEVTRDHVFLGYHSGPPQSDMASSQTIEEFLNSRSWQKDVRKGHGEAVLQEVIAFIKG